MEARVEVLGGRPGEGGHGLVVVGLPAEGVFGEREMPRSHDPFEIEDERVHRWIAVVRVLAQGGEDNLLEPWIEGGDDLGGARGRDKEMGADEADAVDGGEREAAGEHAVQDDAEAINVGALVDFVGDGLFWGHVREGADGHAYAGEVPLVELGEGEV